LKRILLIACALIAALLVLPPSTPSLAQAQPPAVDVVKSNNLGGDPVEPGDTFSWRFELLCTSIEVDCQDYTFTDTIPAGFDVDVTSLPESSADQTVAWDPATRELRVDVHQPIDNPVGQRGLPAGSIVTFDVTVTLRPDAPYRTGDTVTNVAEVEAVNAPDRATDDDAVEVVIPKVVTPVATKGFSRASVVAGSGDAATIRLGVRNASSSSAEVGQLVVTDTTPPRSSTST